MAIEKKGKSQWTRDDVEDVSSDGNSPTYRESRSDFHLHDPDIPAEHGLATTLGSIGVTWSQDRAPRHWGEVEKQMGDDVEYASGQGLLVSPGYHRGAEVSTMFFDKKARVQGMTGLGIAANHAKTIGAGELAPPSDLSEHSAKLAQHLTGQKQAVTNTYNFDDFWANEVPTSPETSVHQTQWGTNIIRSGNPISPEEIAGGTRTIRQHIRAGRPKKAGQSGEAAVNEQLRLF